MGAIVYKQKQLADGAERVAISGPPTDALDKLAKEDFLKKLGAKDPSPWTNDPAAAGLIKHALGWLDIPQHLMEHVPDLETFGKEIAREFDYVVVLGMGGSSLAPDVMSETLGEISGGPIEDVPWPELLVLDSTDPTQIAELDEKLALDRTLFVVSSKSGTTTEPNAFFAYYYEKVAKLVGTSNAGKQFVAVTDPGTQMVEVAKGHNFRRIFENDPNIGGRYSALS